MALGCDGLGLQWPLACGVLAFGALACVSGANCFWRGSAPAPAAASPGATPRRHRLWRAGFGSAMCEAGRPVAQALDAERAEALTHLSTVFQVVLKRRAASALERPLVHDGADHVLSTSGREAGIVVGVHSVRPRESLTFGDISFAKRIEWTTSCKFTAQLVFRPIEKIPKAEMPIRPRGRCGGGPPALEPFVNHRLGSSNS